MIDLIIVSTKYERRSWVRLTSAAKEGRWTYLLLLSQEYIEKGAVWDLPPLLPPRRDVKGSVKVGIKELGSVRFDGAVDGNVCGALSSPQRREYWSLWVSLTYLIYGICFGATHASWLPSCAAAALSTSSSCSDLKWCSKRGRCKCDQRVRKDTLTTHIDDI